ncbi:nickel pincer cofactor biosynthesis protein LarB [Candidatus Fermentibacteria bacterium]|nr:MAG: nickel pincer cofactor biosynthesis protein LarB [Candidatus Fermentibacteria bacterium]
MKNSSIEALLAVLSKGDISPFDALKMLNSHLTPDLGFARVDTGRGVTAVLPEVILAEGKNTEEVLKITENLFGRTGLAIVSRASEDLGRALLDSFPEGRYSDRGRLFVTGEYRITSDSAEGSVAVVSAGTSDLHAVEEAAIILETMKVDTRRFCDIGVAGVHRLAEVLPSLRESSVCIVFAGMDAALPTVIGGLYRGPVIAVPTSTGYGTAFGGVTALLSMLNSCSPGICVLNIDNGLGAATAALRILRGTE